jgi:hypothetical protein
VVPYEEKEASNIIDSGMLLIYYMEFRLLFFTTYMPHQQQQPNG